MATVYTVSIGTRFQVDNMHGSYDHFEPIAVFSMVDGTGNIDRWHLDNSSYWPKHGDGKVNRQSKELLVYTDHLGELVTKFKSIKRWTM